MDFGEEKRKKSFVGSLGEAAGRGDTKGKRKNVGLFRQQRTRKLRQNPPSHALTCITEIGLFFFLPRQEDTIELDIL